MWYYSLISKKAYGFTPYAFLLIKSIAVNIDFAGSNNKKVDYIYVPNFFIAFVDYYKYITYNIHKL